MANHTFILNGKRVNVDVEDDVRLLWVLRDILGVTGPKYGCGIAVCQACTCHRNGRAFQPCSIPVSALRPNDKITTIEGLPGTVGTELHPMQEAWLEHDVSQCGYCQPGQIMAAVALVQKAHRSGRTISDADLDELRNVCRCGTYPRIREAIADGAAEMARQASAARTKARSKARRSHVKQTKRSRARRKRGLPLRPRVKVRL